MKMNKGWLLGFVLALFGLSAHAQIPVSDTASVLQGIKNTAQQITQLKQQYDQAMQAYNSITGNRGFGNFSTQQLSSLLPSDLQQIEQAYAGQGSAGATAAIQQILNQEKNKNSQATLTDRLKAEADQSWTRAAGQKSMLQNAFEGMQKRLDGLSTLQGQIATTQDPKAIQELNARINVEQGVLQAEQSKIALLKTISDNEKDLDAQRQRDELAKIMDSNNTGMASLK